MQDRRAAGSGLARPGLLAPAITIPVLFCVLALALPAQGDGTDPERRATPSLDDLQVRAAVLGLGAGRIEGFYEARVAPVERILGPHHGDAHFLRRLSLALVLEGDAAGVGPRVLTSLLLVENPRLDPEARSFMGAVGLMQVMPFHAGLWGCESSDLTEVSANVCHGARIFAAYLRQHGGDLDRALLAYNGCVHGVNTPDCHLYPRHVYSNAGRLAIEEWLGVP